MEACTKSPETSLDARTYKGTWANSLLKLCEAGLAIADKKAVQRLVIEIHRFEMYSNETGSKFVDLIKGHAAKIGNQSERETQTDILTITVAKKLIRLQHPTLYQVLESRSLFAV